MGKNSIVYFILSSADSPRCSLISEHFNSNCELRNVSSSDNQLSTIVLSRVQDISAAAESIWNERFLRRIKNFKIWTKKMFN